MTFHSRIKCKGLAPLEMLLVFPLLVTMLVLIFFTAKVSLHHLYLDNEVRHETWKVRDSLSTPLKGVRPLCFGKIDSNATAETDPQGDMDIEEKEKNTDIKTGLIFDKWNLKSEQKHTLFVDTWDFQTHRRNHVNNNIGNPRSDESPGNNVRIFMHQQGYSETKYSAYPGKLQCLYITNLPYYEPKEGVATSPVINKPYTAKENSLTE